MNTIAKRLNDPKMQLPKISMCACMAATVLTAGLLALGGCSLPGKSSGDSEISSNTTTIEPPPGISAANVVASYPTTESGLNVFVPGQSYVTSQIGLNNSGAEDASIRCFAIEYIDPTWQGTDSNGQPTNMGGLSSVANTTTLECAGTTVATARDLGAEGPIAFGNVVHFFTGPVEGTGANQKTLDVATIPGANVPKTFKVRSTLNGNVVGHVLQALPSPGKNKNLIWLYGLSTRSRLNDGQCVLAGNPEKIAFLSGFPRFSASTHASVTSGYHNVAASGSIIAHAIGTELRGSPVIIRQIPVSIVKSGMTITNVTAWVGNPDGTVGSEIPSAYVASNGTLGLSDYVLDQNRIILIKVAWSGMTNGASLSVVLGAGTLDSGFNRITSAQGTVNCGIFGTDPNLIGATMLTNGPWWSFYGTGASADIPTQHTFNVLPTAPG